MVRIIACDNEPLPVPMSVALRNKDLEKMKNDQFYNMIFKFTSIMNLMIGR